MARRGTGHSFIGLVLEIGLIAGVVWLLPKANLRPQTDSPAKSSWWQAAPTARETSWREIGTEEIRVEETLENASRRLFPGATDYGSRAGAELIAPLESEWNSMPARPADAKSQPDSWRRY